MTCRCLTCLWSAREPNELLRMQTDIAGRNAEEAYVRQRREARRSAPSADVPPPVAGRAEHAALGAAEQPDAGTPAGPGLPPTAGGAGSDNSALSHVEESRPVALHWLRGIRRWPA